LGRKLGEAGFPSEIIKQVLEELEWREQPFLEKTNTFIFMRQWDGREATALELASMLALDARNFLERGRGAAPAYAQVVSHFSSDLLAQLYREAQRRLPYAGFETLVELSQGIPRNLLGMLSHIYRRAVFAGERPFSGGPPL
jgi:hypothetical protein